MKRHRRRFFADFWKILACASVLLALGLKARAQVLNDWTNPVSARWDSLTNWSLRILPASNQTVSITNSGYKAVDIDSSTFATNLDSVTVSNLIISAPTNGLNTLLLNYAGTTKPLKVLRSCTIGTNGAMDNFQSSFEVDGNNGGQLLVDGGTFVQESGLGVVNGPVFVSNNGSFYATNANLTLGEVTIGSAPASVGSFTQDGGSILAQRINVPAYSQDPFGPGGYRLVSGVLYAINGTQVAAIGPGFRQFGGTNYGDIIATGGYYALLGGYAQGNVLTAASPDGNATLFDQEGGLLDMKFINISGGTNWPPQLGPWFSGGTVHCGTLNIGGNARMEMRGADFYITNNFDLHGMEFNVGDQGPLIEHAVCVQWAGNVYLPSMSLGQYAYFDLMGGSNEISGGLSLFGGQYSQYGGVLETTYTGVGAAATFVHGEGQHFVHGVLSITGTYALTGVAQEGGCNLVCEGLYLRGALTMVITDNGRFLNPPATFTNTGSLNLGGTISTELPDVELGRVQLATNALIDLSVRFPAGVRFANSSAMPWTAGALLVITNWSNSDHVFAGSEASGLSASQLRQVEFVNPGGFTPGAYPAQILSSGEIVPGQPPTLVATRVTNALVLTWSGNYQLLSATNVAGPYLPVPGASSPQTNFFNAPQQFFRLQASP